MQAGNTRIGGIFQYGRLLEVPFYQRSYVWDTTQWSRFLEDTSFLSKSKKVFFFGSIILKNAPVSNTDEAYVTDKKVVIDGQQRLTTLMIFLRVLALKTNNAGAFDVMFCLPNGEPKLSHGKYDHADFNAVIKKVDIQLFPVNEHTSQIIKAFNYFSENISPNDYDWNEILKNSLFIEIGVQESEDEQQVFDTINSPGVSLTTAELLKNFFFKKENTAAYEKDWVAVFEPDAGVRDYWLQEIEAGRRKRVLIDVFFDAFFQILVDDKKYNVTAEDRIAFSRLDRLSISIKEFISKYCGGNKQVIIEQMSEYANSFRNAIMPDAVKTNIPADSGLERINVLIFGLSNTTIIPYILFIEKNVTSDSERAKMYGILEAYIMRRLVCHADNKNYNRFIASLILNRVLTATALCESLQSENNATDSTMYIPNDTELKQNFREAKLVNLQSKGILYLIETKIHPNMSAVALLGFDNYSLEHLMPKKWRNNWSGPKGEDAARRDSELLTLGNLAIIPQSLNASIRDASWQVKLSGKGYKAGLSACAAGLETMREVLKKTEWNETCIAERALWLYRHAAKVWHIDGLNGSSDEENDNPG